MAELLNVSQSSVGRITRKVCSKPFKMVKTTHDTETKRRKRERIAGEVLQMYAGGMRSKRIFWSDETWVDKDTCKRWNPQNDRRYYPKGTAKDAVLDDLRAPLRQRSAGVMVHITVSSARQGVVLKPHFVDPKKTMTAEYYVSMLTTDVFPQISTIVGEGSFWWQQDLASPHTAKITTAYLAERSVMVAPWLPCGADVSPLDIYVNPELKKRLDGKDLESPEKIMAETAKALAEMGADEAFLKGLNKCCRGIKRRMQYVAANGGKICAKSLLAKWSGKDE